MSMEYSPIIENKDKAEKNVADINLILTLIGEELKEYVNGIRQNTNWYRYESYTDFFLWHMKRKYIGLMRERGWVSDEDVDRVVEERLQKCRAKQKGD